MGRAMRLPTRHKAPDGLPGVTGTARVDRRTSALLPRLRRGDIAVIDHLDLDRATAEAFVEAGVVGVVNASPFISGRYPNLGPAVLAQADVMMVEGVSADIFSAVGDGSALRLDGDQVFSGSQSFAGTAVDRDGIEQRMQDARAGLATQLESFTHNATEFLRREQDLLLHGLGIPSTRTEVSGRPVVVVSKGYDYRADLARLKRYIREQDPVLIGVDAGADALLAARHTPDIVVLGQAGLGKTGSRPQDSPDQVSDAALRRARDLVVHTDKVGHITGTDRLQRLGLTHATLAATGTTEDVALLLADVAGASLVVTVGSHVTLDEFLDRQRAGLASIFLTRLRVGPKIVEAKSVPELYAGRVRLWHLLLVLLAGLLAIGVAVAATPVGNEWWTDLSQAISDLLQGLTS